MVDPHVANGNVYDLKKLLEEETGADVYVQAPPRDHQLQIVCKTYPTIIIERRTGETTYADDRPYVYTTAYTLTVITQDPYDKTPDKVVMLPMCKFDRTMFVNNLHHDIYMIYF